MNRIFKTYPVAGATDIKSRMLNCAKQFNIFCFLDNHRYDYSSSSFECMMGAGALHSLQLMAGSALSELQIFKETHQDWLFGHLGYDLKNEIEELSSNNPDGIGFPDLFFFVPRIVVILDQNELRIGVIGKDPDEVFASIMDEKNEFKSVITSGSQSPGESGEIANVSFINSRFSREEYIETIKKLQSHILRGDCYEINFCQEFYIEDAVVDPIDIFRKLAAISPNPFAALYRLENKYCICESPERYLRKTGEIIISQPIKGTAQRNLHDPEVDIANKNSLKSSKEQSENVMIVDLVRNDLSKVCREGSVNVDELFGIYQFPHLYQMISTISGNICEGIMLDQIIKATFPMGSMTGAPKKNVMKLIEEYERSRRGLFSGSIGYISPTGDFDFNVVIRSILFNASKKYLSIHAGSAITYYSDPEKEYEECLLKISAIRKVFED